MYPRLKVGRNLLKNNGIICVAIDDHEYHNLKLIMNEIYGESNYMGTIITKCNPQGRGKKNLDPVHEYHLIYAKDITKTSELLIKRKSNTHEYQTFLRSGTNSRKMERPKRYYPILIKDNEIHMITPEEYNFIYRNNMFDENHINFLVNKYQKLGFKVVFPIAKNGEKKVWQRTYERALKEYKTYIYENGIIKTPKNNLRTPTSLWTGSEYSNVTNGTNILLKLFDKKKTFDYPKSYITVKDIISLNRDNDIVLDFFSGSGTTAQSVFELNFEDDKNRRFILVQIDQEVDKNSDAYKNGFKTLCDIAKTRIRKVGDNFIKKSKKHNIDVGFKVFELKTSNFKEWNPNYNCLNESLEKYMYNLVEGRSELDLVYEIMLKYGIDITLPIDEYENDGYKLYSVGAGALIICLDDMITKDVANSIVDLKNELNPFISRVVLKDSGFVSDADKVNVREILKNNEVEEFITI